MGKIYTLQHDRPNCIGCGACSVIAPKFWEMNDALYRLAGNSSAIDLQQLGHDTGLEVQGLVAALRHPGYRNRLEVDIRHGLKLRILGAPSYLINGQVYEGSIPAAILNSVWE